MHEAVQQNMRVCWLVQRYWPLPGVTILNGIRVNNFLVSDPFRSAAWTVTPPTVLAPLQSYLCSVGLAPTTLWGVAYL